MKPRSRWKRWTALGALSLLMYAVLVLAFAPARYAAAAVDRFSQGAVRLDNPQGSLWHGAALLHVAALGQDPLGTLSWRVRPWQLLRLALVVECRLTGTDMEASTIAELGLRRHRARDLALRLPAARVQQFYPAAALLGLGGDIDLTATTLTLHKQSIDGAATLNWKQAASRMLPVQPLGDYVLVMTGKGPALAFDVQTVQGALQLSGKGSWDAYGDGSAQVDVEIGSFTPQPALEPVLGMLGPAQVNGRRKLQQRIPMMKLQPERLFPL